MLEKALNLLCMQVHRDKAVDARKFHALGANPGTDGYTGFILLIALSIAEIGHYQGNAVGVGALIISAILTACYLFPVVVNMYFRPINESLHVAEGANRDPDWRMTLPFILLCVTIVVLCFCAYPMTNWLAGVAGGLY